jgi:molybdate transport system substrate-binding protein
MLLLPVFRNRCARAPESGAMRTGEVIVRTVFAACRIAAVVVLAQGVTAQAAEIKVIAGTGLSGVLGELGPQFERATGHKLVVSYGVTGTMKRQIESGEVFDIAIVPASLLDEVSKQGKIVAGTRTEIARVGFGIGVRAGAAKPDVSSLEAFKNTLLAAKSISYVPEGVTGMQLTAAFERLGIAEQMKAKTKAQQLPEQVRAAVASGEAELGFALANILTSGTGVQLASGGGVELAGVFPAELQSYVVQTAGVSANAKEPDAAKALIKLLTAEESAAVIKAKGMEPVAR